MKRAALERNRTRNVWLRHLRSHGGNVICACDLQPNRFRKGQRVAGCGRPRCWLCHSNKLASVPSVQDLRSRIYFKEAVA